MLLTFKLPQEISLVRDLDEKVKMVGIITPRCFTDVQSLFSTLRMLHQFHLKTVGALVARLCCHFLLHCGEADHQNKSAELIGSNFSFEIPFSC